MSSTYNLEPNPTAKVVLHTTTGDLELELFAKQTPIASRNFLQLCLDGYYDNTVFHRLVKGFILQGGDPTGTGQGGESSYDGEPFADEFNSRLKFARRGLLGMANTGNKDENGSQFFFTLGATPELQGKNTMFGRVAGDTIYNLMKMSEVELAEGSEERPMYPTRITSSDIIINPFEDMVRRVQVARRSETDIKKSKKPKRKAGKALLSFGGDENADAESPPVLKKAKFNAKLVSAEEGLEPMLKQAPLPKPSQAERAIPIRKPIATSDSRSPSPQPVQDRAAAPVVPAPAPAPARAYEQPSAPRELSAAADKQSKLDRVNAQIAELKASMKRESGRQRAEPTKKKSLLDSMIPANTVRGRKRGAAGTGTNASLAALDALQSFKARLESAEATSKPVYLEHEPTRHQEATSAGNDNSPTLNGTEEVPCDLHFVIGCQSCTAWDEQDREESDDDTGWMSHALSFAKDRLGKDLEWKRKNEEELVVIDPLERTKEMKAERRTKRDWDDGKGRAKMKI